MSSPRPQPLVPSESSRTPVLPPSSATLPEPTLFAGGFSLPRLARLVPAAVAIGAAALSFGAGYGLRGRTDARRMATAKTRQAAPKIVRRTDTVRVARSDTVVLARFVLADAAAKSVALIGDFNRWDDGSTALTRLAPGVWGRTVSLSPGRHEYAFIVDGKHWTTDRLSRTSHDAFDVESSVITIAGTSPSDDGSSASARLKKLLPRTNASRVLAAIASAREQKLPATILESRALKFAARRVKPTDIEDAIVADAEAMGKAQRLLVAAGRHQPTADEIDAAAQLLGEGTDSASVGALAKFAAAGRSIDVPLRVGAELVATSSAPRETLARVADRVQSGASDAQLEAMLDAPPVRVASREKGKGGESKTATKAGSVRQAGKPAKKPSPKKPSGA
jgi:hypothetical protein